MRVAGLSRSRGRARGGAGGAARRARAADPRRRRRRRPRRTRAQARGGAGRDRRRPADAARAWPGRSEDAARVSREAALGDVRGGAERAIPPRPPRRGPARRAPPRGPAQRLARGEELLDDVRAALAAVEAAGAAIRARVERIEGRSSAARATATRSPRSCAPARSRSRAAGADADGRRRADQGRGRGGAPRRPPRRGERELAPIAERLGEEVAPAEQPLGDEERAEIDRRLERLERRRAQIGPVNPLAEREYDEAREHVE